MGHSCNPRVPPWPATTSWGTTNVCQCVVTTQSIVHSCVWLMCWFALVLSRTKIVILAFEYILACEIFLNTNKLRILFDLSIFNPPGTCFVPCHAMPWARRHVMLHSTTPLQEVFLVVKLIHYSSCGLLQYLLLFFNTPAWFTCCTWQTTSLSFDVVSFQNIPPWFQVFPIHSFSLCILSIPTPQKLVTFSPTMNVLTHAKSEVSHNAIIIWMSYWTYRSVLHIGGRKYHISIRYLPCFDMYHARQNLGTTIQKSSNFFLWSRHEK